MPTDPASAPPTTPRPASWLRREPWRLLFPIGAVLAIAGVVPWLLFGLGEWPGWPVVEHSIVEIQGFLSTFLAGFLLTALPRRTGTPPPSTGLVALAVVAPVATSALGMMRSLAASQLPWLVLMVALAVSASRRFRDRAAGRRPPDCFVWIPLALGMGLSGTVLLAIYHPLGLDFGWHRLGQLLLLQGMFAALIVGVGGLAIPVMTRGEGPPDGAADRPGPRHLHRLAAVLLAATFAIECFGAPTLGLALRAALLTVLVVAVPKAHRVPTRPGLVRRILPLAVWCLPLGYAVAALLHGIGHGAWVHIGLHVVFLGGFAMSTLMVGMHVGFGHGGRDDLANGTPWQAWAIAALVLVALLFRILVVLDPTVMTTWLVAASVAFAGACLVWFTARLRVTAR